MTIVYLNFPRQKLCLFGEKISFILFFHRQQLQLLKTFRAYLSLEKHFLELNENRYQVCQQMEVRKLALVMKTNYGIQEEYDEVQLRSGAKGALFFIAQARDWESHGEYRKALECYMKVREAATNDIEMIVAALMRV